MEKDKFIVHVIRRNAWIRTDNGFVYEYAPHGGEQIILIECSIISNYKMTIDDYYREVQNLDDVKLEVVASLINEFTIDFKSVEIPNGHGGLISLSELGTLIIPMINVKREREAYQKEMELFLSE